MLKSQVDRKRFNNESSQQKKGKENNQSNFQNIITDSSNTQPCSSRLKSERKKENNQTYQTDNIKEYYNRIEILSYIRSLMIS